MADSEYDYSKMGSGVDQTFDAEKGAEAFIEVVLQKTELPVREELTFKHSGARGDLMYALPTIAAMGGGTLYVSTDDTHYVGRGMDETEVLGLCEMLKTQEYITDAKLHKGEQVDIDLDDFRDLNVDNNLISVSHLIRFGAKFDLSKPWLEGINPKPIADIVVSRSTRYHGILNWGVLKEYEGKCSVVYLGLPEEHKQFVIETGLSIPCYQADDHQEMASIIAGAKLFIGNQSYPYALAEAMKVPRVLEVCQHCPNCNPQDENGHIVLSTELISSALEGSIVKSTYGMRQTHKATPYIIPPPEFPPKLWRKPKVSVVVLVEKNDTEVDAISRKRDAEAFKGAEVFVVWLRGDEPPEALGEVIRGDTKEQSKVINGVMDKASGDFLLMVESWCWIDEDGIQDMINQFTDKKVGLVGQEMVLEGFPHIGRGVLMMSRLAYEHCGFFNEAMRPKGWQGLEICLRLQELGYGNRQARSRNVNVVDKNVYEGHDAVRNADYINRRYGVKV
jgi:hypothetical protein